MFITLEGGEGTGKTTQAVLLRHFLEEYGRSVITTREPGGTEGAEELRNIVCQGDIGKWSSLAETLIYYAARRDHMEKKILPALQKGVWVISDRFADSTLAYQYYGYNKSGISFNDLMTIHNVVLKGFAPDLTFILDVSPELSLERVAEKQRFEKMDIAFHKRLREGYLEIAKAEPQRCVVIDASQSIEEVSCEIKEEVKKRFFKE